MFIMVYANKPNIQQLPTKSTLHITSIRFANSLSSLSGSLSLSESSPLLTSDWSLLSDSAISSSSSSSESLLALLDGWSNFLRPEDDRDEDGVEMDLVEMAEVAAEDFGGGCPPADNDGDEAGSCFGVDEMMEGGCFSWIIFCNRYQCKNRNHISGHWSIDTNNSKRSFLATHVTIKYKPWRENLTGLKKASTCVSKAMTWDRHILADKRRRLTWKLKMWKLFCVEIEYSKL